MLERKQYNREIENARKRQVEEISKYISEYYSYFADIRKNPVVPMATEEDFKLLENTTIPKKGRDLKEVGDEIVGHILSKSVPIQHPRFLSLVTSSVSPYSLAGSILTDIYNPNVAGFGTAPLVSLVEEKIIKWMGSRAGFDTKKCGGIFTSGGSLSNLTGMIAARENKLPGRVDLAKGVAFTSDQAHSSVVKGMRMMGLRSDQIVIIESDNEFKIRLDLLKEAIEAKIKEGYIPFLIVGTVGTTNTGSIDPLDCLADIAEDYNMWLHVDGAYGGSILISDMYRPLAKGIERVDSFSWDTHKWAMQTYACSSLIAKDKQTLITAFNEHPEYLADVRESEHNDGWDLGIEMSRPARCIKLWFTLQCMGTDLLADVIDYAFYNALSAQNALKALPDWEIVSKPMCGAINFRYVPKEVKADLYNELNHEITEKLLNDGYAYVITTVLKGKRVIRFCLINGSTETEDVLNVIEKMNEIAISLKEKYKNR